MGFIRYLFERVDIPNELGLASKFSYLKQLEKKISLTIAASPAVKPQHCE